MTQPNLNPCDQPGYTDDLNIDSIPAFCREMELDANNKVVKTSLNDITGRDFSWLEEQTQEKTGNGASANADPIQAGHIINDQKGAGVGPNRNVLYRYSKALHGADEAMEDMFRDLVIIDEQGKAHNVPIMWATQEAAVAALVQENYRNDDSLVVDRIRLPIMAIHSSELTVASNRYVYHKAVDYIRDPRRGNKPGFTTKEGRHERDTIFGVARGIPVDIGYTLYAWTMHREDMNQILEQVLMKFSPFAYIRVRGVSLEVMVKLDNVANNIEVSPGDKDVNVYKYQFKMTVESYVPQPIIRKKAVLSTKVEIVDSLDDEDITEVISRLETVVKALE